MQSGNQFDLCYAYTMNSAKARVILTANEYVRGGEKGGEKGPLQTNVEQALQEILKKRKVAEKRKHNNVQTHANQPFVVLIAKRRGDIKLTLNIEGVQEKLLKEVNSLIFLKALLIISITKGMCSFVFYTLHRRWRKKNLSATLFQWIVKVHSSSCIPRGQLASSLVLNILQLDTCFMLHFHIR